jgi:hypothetical protein
MNISAVYHRGFLVQHKLLFLLNMQYSLMKRTFSVETYKVKCKLHAWGGGHQKHGPSVGQTVEWSTAAFPSSDILHLHT